MINKDLKPEMHPTGNEPTKPCEWCSGERKVEGGFTLDYGYFLDFLSAENRHFCPNCGRRLTDD